MNWHIGELTLDVGETTSYVGELTRWWNDRLPYLFIFNSQVDVREEFIPEKCELFESEVYLEEVSDVICIAQAELPSLLALNQLAEALLRVKHGPWLLCQLVANAPDSFEQG